MRTSFWLVFLLLIGAQYNCASLQKSLLDGIRAITPFMGEASADEEEAEKKKQTEAKLDQAIAALKKDKMNQAIFFHDYRTLDPDEGGGVSLHLAVWNTSDDPIDNINIIVQAIDEDGSPHLIADKPVSLNIKGPIDSHKALIQNPGKNKPQPFSHTVRNIWWSDSIACSQLTEINIQFTSGKKSRLTGDQISDAMKLLPSSDPKLCL